MEKTYFGSASRQLQASSMQSCRSSKGYQRIYLLTRLFVMLADLVHDHKHLIIKRKKVKLEIATGQT